MGTTRLRLYNAALVTHCKERPLATLTDQTKSRRLLDQVWNDGLVDYVLEQGQWQFAMRAGMWDFDPDATPEFGYRYAFGKPDDWILTSAVCSDEYFKEAVTEYADEEDWWTSDTTPLYIKYVSNDAQFGADLGRWPSTFADYVSAYLAGQIVLSLTGDKEIASALLHPKTGIIDRTKLVAKNRAQMTQPTKYPQRGSWVRARAGMRRRGPMGDGGTGSALTG